MEGPGPPVSGRQQGVPQGDAARGDAAQGGTAPDNAGRDGAAPEDALPPNPSQEYTELVLDLVAQIPAGRASSYGAIADAARVLTGRGSARTVGRIMAHHGGQVPWWRVVPATGVVPAHLRDRAAVHLRAEGTALRGTDPLRLDMRTAGWAPPI